MPMALLFSGPVSCPISTSLVPSSKPFLPQTPATPVHAATCLPNPGNPLKPLLLRIWCPAHPRAASTGAYFSLDVGENLEAKGEVDEVSPWEGAVVYYRDPTVTHLEYATTLERLGLDKMSTKVSRTRAADMGMRIVSRRRKEGDHRATEESTPVLVSVDVTRKKGKLRLDGIVRTVITLPCKRCAQPAAEAVFSNFTLLLTEDLEEIQLNKGTIFGEYKSRSSTSDQDDEDDESFIDLDDRLHFPRGEKEIDISKHIRDIVHVEITMNAICDAGCKGICLICGINLNKSSCICGSEVEQNDGDFGPFKSLKKRMQKR